MTDGVDQAERALGGVCWDCLVVLIVMGACHQVGGDVAFNRSYNACVEYVFGPRHWSCQGYT